MPCRVGPAAPAATPPPGPEATMSKVETTAEAPMPAPSREYLPHLAVYVVWHPKFIRKEAPAGDAGEPVVTPGGLDLARALYADLAGDPEDPTSEGVGVPVYYRTGTPGAAVPAAIPLDEARRTAVVVLIDPEMMAGRDKGWSKYILGLWKLTGESGGRHRVLPVAITPNAFNFDPTLGGTNFIRYFEVDPGKRVDQLVIHVTHELCRQVMGEDRADHGVNPGAALADRVEVFISHAKYDGRALAEAVRDHIRSDQQLSTFFDSNDIYFGKDFQKVLDDRVPRAAMLVVHTDAYSQSEFCRGEVLLAKSSQRPIYTLDAIQKRVRRTFPYMYNGPSGRHTATEPVDFRPVVKGLLLEVLRIEHFRRHFEELCGLFNIPRDQGIEPLPYPPELLTLVDLRLHDRTANVYVYPDPPLSVSETRKLDVLAKDVKLTTPILLLTQAQHQASLNEAPGVSGAALPKPAPRPTAAAAAAMVEASANIVDPGQNPRGWLIGLSISDLPEPDLLRLGFGPEHLTDASADFALYLLAAQYQLAYGGDLRKKGFTETLHELVHRYNSNNFGPRQVLRNYLAWYIHATTPAEDKERFAKAGREIDVDPPDDLKLADPDSPPDPTSPDFPYVRARCLTAMRQRMNQDIQARVIVGGKTVGYNGTYPGVVEEADFAVRSQTPMYLIGAFGGAARAIIEAIQGGTPQELTQPFQEQSPSNTGYAAFLGDFNARARQASQAAGTTLVEPIDYAALVGRFHQYGIAGLSHANGLSPKENETLFSTTDVKEMIYLSLKGLFEVRNRGRSGGP
jgi:hypothetical protein